MMVLCPKCGKYYSGRPALSREDNETNICPTCGIIEALKDTEKMLNNGNEKKKFDGV